MHRGKIAFALAVAAFGASYAMVVHAQQSSNGAATKSSSGQVHSIVLPDEPVTIPPGPNVNTYTRNCLICHSERYVLMQPRFPKTVWEKEVKKMVDSYGAPIPESDQPLIVQYLMAVRGAEAPAGSSSTAK